MFVDNPVSSKIPLDLGFCAVLTIDRPSERMVAGALRRAQAPSLGATEARSGAGARTRSTDHFQPGRGRLRAAAATRGRRRAGDPGNREFGAESGQTESPGDRWPRRPAGFVGKPADVARYRVDTVRRVGDGPWNGADGSGVTPTGLGEGGSAWHQDRWHGQPGQREPSDISGRETGNRRPHRIRGIARRAQARRAM